jgi:isoleucyl-tRNA synthetase
LRNVGKIGADLQAAITITAEGAQYEALAALGEDLKYIFIASAASVRQGAFQVEVSHASGEKCERCWHVREDVGRHAEHPKLCARCISNLYGSGETREKA